MEKVPPILGLTIGLRSSNSLRTRGLRRALATLAAALFAALAPNALHATDWSDTTTLTVYPSSTNITLYDPVDIYLHTNSYSSDPGVGFEQDLTVYANGTIQIDSYVNDQYSTDYYPASLSGSNCDIDTTLNWNVSSPALDGNNDPYIWMYDGSTGDDGRQTSSSGTIYGGNGGDLSSAPVSASISGNIVFDTNNAWQAICYLTFDVTGSSRK